MLLQIRPGLVQAWRAPGRLQIGLDPRCGVVLDGLTAADEHVLAALACGTYDRGRLHAHAGRWGLRPERVDELVDVLARSGVLLPTTVPAPVLARLGDTARERLAPTARRLAVAFPAHDGWDLLARRLASAVVVQGGCRLGLRTAATLAASGLGSVEVHDDSPVLPDDVGPGAYLRTDVGRRRGEAAADRLARVLALPADRGPGGHPAGQAGPQVLPGAVVLVAAGAVDPSRYAPWTALDVPHLAVVVREADVVVGPLVRAGRGCCLRCVELFRADRDPQWPRVAAQLAAVRGHDDGPRPRGHDVAVAEHAAAVAAGEVLTLLDGVVEPATTGRTLEVGPGSTVPVRRSWPAHARCGCAGLPGARSARPDAPAGGAPSMMGG